jgi:hypothetical protein
MNTMKKYLVLLSMILCMWCVPQVAQAQCPMCKAAVTTGSNYGAKENKLVAGLNSGILYLFLLPYGSIMLLGTVLVIHYRRNKRRNGQELSETTVADVIGDHQAPSNDGAGAIS